MCAMRTLYARDADAMRATRLHEIRPGLEAAAFPPSLPVSRLYGRDLDFGTVSFWKRELFYLEGGQSRGRNYLEWHAHYT